MPNIGDITIAPKIGYKGRARFIWVACPDCGVERWRPLHNPTTRCWKCSANHRERQHKPLTFFGDGEPKVGDTARASVVGMIGRSIHIYAACPECGVARWTRMRYKDTPCPSCTAKIYNSRSGSKHPRWKGGAKRTHGYVYVPVSRNDPLFVMSTRRYKNSAVVAEHRLVVARLLGRPLLRHEVVHHINGVKDDNRPENLQLLNEHAHHPALVLQELQKQLMGHESRLLSLERENSLLRSALQEIRDSIPESIPNIRCYNTLSNRLIEQIEGIVQSTSNGDRDQDRSSCVRRKLILRPSSAMAMKNPANSVEPVSNGYGNAELGVAASAPSVETLHGTPQEGEDKVRLSSKGESE